MASLPTSGRLNSFLRVSGKATRPWEPSRVTPLPLPLSLWSRALLIEHNP